MIRHDEFGRLRMSRFVPASKVTPLDAWEFQGHLWVGEGLGLSEFLRLRGDPNVVRSVAVDFEDFPHEAASAVLREIGLPVHHGMSAAELDRLLGKRVAEHRLVGKRKSIDYLTPPPNRYRVSCDLDDTGALRSVVIMVPPIGDEA